MKVVRRLLIGWQRLTIAPDVYHSLLAVDRAVHVRKDVEAPDTTLAAAYADLYRRFVRLYPGLTGSGAFE